jgi:hypothetical protein
MSSTIPYIKTLTRTGTMSRKLELDLEGETCGMVNNMMCTPSHKKRGETWQYCDKTEQTADRPV